MLAGCSDKADFNFREVDRYIDADQKLTRKDYKALSNIKEMQRLADEINASAKPELKIVQKSPPIPNVSQILAQPRAPKIGSNKLVSLSVTDDVPLRDVLIELGRLADIDMEIDPNISGGIIFRAKDRPFSEVIERISDMAGLHYSMKGNVLRVEMDRPQVKNYSVDFLNFTRSSKSEFNIRTNVLSSSGGEGGGDGGLNSGSSAEVKSESESDLWSALESGVRSILSWGRPSSENGGGVASAALAPAAEGEAAAGEGGSAGASAGGSVGGDNYFYVFNRQAGVLTVSATGKQHEQIDKFLRVLKAQASAQVLIEAKIVEVALNDRYESGVDWSLVGNSLGVFVPDANSLGAFEEPGNAIAFAINRDIGMDLNAIIRFIQRFGTTRTLSSPRLHAMNNQQSVLTFAQNKVYFEIDVQREQNNTGGSSQSLLTVNSTVKTVPIGLILSILPSVDLETGEITLSVRPTLSRQTGEVSDPAVAFLAQQDNITNLQNLVPVIEVRELESLLKLRSGQVMVIGGLMEQRGENEDRGLPGVSEVPIVGNLFKGSSRVNTVSELVIFIRASIVGTDTRVDPNDQLLYKRFTSDPRPLKFN
jgi:general secretion pathway protein D